MNLESDGDGSCQRALETPRRDATLTRTPRDHGPNQMARLAMASSLHFALISVVDGHGTA